MNRKLDEDIIKMTPRQCAQELMRVSQIIRRHKKFRNHERCHYNDDYVYDHVLPEGSADAGFMVLSSQVLIRGCEQYHRRNNKEMSPRCERYIRRQKSRLKGQKK